jgi:hypothetical protein
MSSIDGDDEDEEGEIEGSEEEGEGDDTEDEIRSYGNNEIGCYHPNPHDW